jgi:peptidoglycan/LPS O-acetylase OafA/YrhL
MRLKPVRIFGGPGDTEQFPGQQSGFIVDAIAYKPYERTTQVRVKMLLPSEPGLILTAMSQPPEGTRTSRKNLPALTSLRFVAAAMIVVGHASEQFGSLGLARFPLNQGVSFFFVLSGFILYYNYPDFRHPDQVSRFIVARLARIWPGHVMCLFLFFCFLPRDLWYIPYPFPTLWTLLVLNVMLVQSWIPFKQVVLSLNGVAWSISVEMFFYLMFPLLVFYRRYWHWHFMANVFLIILTIVLLVQNELPIETGAQGLTALGLIYTNPIVRILEFQAGILTARVFLASRKLHLRMPTAALIEIAAVFVILLTLYFVPVMAERLMPHSGYSAALGFWLINEGAFPAFAVLIFVIARQDGPLTKFLSLPFMIFLGEVSFAIYLLHQIILRGWTIRFGAFIALPTALQYALFWIVLITAAASMHMLIERPARKILVDSWSKRVRHKRIL